MNMDMNEFKRILSSNSYNNKQKLIQLKNLVDQKEQFINESAIADDVTYIVNSTNNSFSFISLDEEDNFEILDIGVDPMAGLALADALKKYYTSKLGEDYLPN